MIPSCHFQGTRYLKGDDGILRKPKQAAEETKCEEPIFDKGPLRGLPKLAEGLVHTEENQRRTLYYRDTLRYRESLGANGHTTRYNKCGESLGIPGKDPKDCLVTPAATGARDPRIEGVKVAGETIKFDDYGANGAFTRIHFKEGSQETDGYLRIHNPPAVYDQRGGRLYGHYLDGRERVGYHRRLATGTHDERACALGIEQFCQTSTPGQTTFRTGFYNAAGAATPGKKVEAAALAKARTPGKATKGKEKAYRDARGFLAPAARGIAL